MYLEQAQSCVKRCIYQYPRSFPGSATKMEDRVAQYKEIALKLQAKNREYKELLDKTLAQAEKSIDKISKQGSVIIALEKKLALCQMQAETAIKTIAVLRHVIASSDKASLVHDILVVSESRTIGGNMSEYIKKCLLALRPELLLTIQAVTPAQVMAMPPAAYARTHAVFCVPTKDTYWSTYFKAMKPAYKRARILFPRVSVMVLSRQSSATALPKAAYKNESMVTMTAEKAKLTINADAVITVDERYEPYLKSDSNIRNMQQFYRSVISL